MRSPQPLPARAATRALRATVPPRSGPSLRHPARLALAALALGVLAGCSRPVPVEEPVRAVKLLTVGSDRLQAVHEYAGEVRARTESRLGFRVGGKLVRREAEVGQRVQPGQLLAVLDPQDLALAVEAARAQAAAAVTQRDLAQAEFNRYRALKDQHFISGAELERREATLRAAQASLEQAQAQLAAQGNQSAYTRLLADAAGVVTAVEAEPGQVVAAGAPVVRLALDGPRDVVFAVPEDRVGEWRVGQAVAVRRWGAADTLAATVREVGASADPVTRTFAVKLALAATQAPAPALGTTVTVLPPPRETPAGGVIKLPTSALRQEGAGSAVWVYEPASGTVRSQAVQVATADGNAVVIASGLQPGQQVVATGVHVLTPGQKVTVYQPKVPIPVTAASSDALKNVANPAPAPNPAAAPAR